MAISNRSPISTSVEGEHRDGICESCGIQMKFERNDEGTIIGTLCGKCGGRKGRLISRSVSIQNPDPPKCFRFSCLWNFYLKVVRSWMIFNYHRRRVAYAEKNRHRTIPMKYRTGEDAPEGIRQAIFAIIKLSLRR